MRLISTLFILLSLLSLSGCGDLFGKKKVPKEFDSSRFQAKCDLDIARFSNILHEPITSQINCLQSNINLFIDLVENDYPGMMSRKAFEAYLRTYRSEDITEDVISAIKAVYDVNYLLTGDDKEYISKASVEKIFHFLRVFNLEASRYFARTFQNETAATYEQHKYDRGEVKGAAIRISEALGKVWNRNGSETRKLDIMALLRSFKTPETANDIEKVKDLLFAKKILLGGNKNILTHHEVGDLITRFHDFIALGLDAVRFKYIDLNQESLISLVKKNIDSINDIIYPENRNRDGEDFFTIDEIFHTVKMFVTSGEFDVDKYRNLIVEMKLILMGGNDNKVTGKDFRAFMNHIKTILLTGESFHSMYKIFIIPLESKLGPLVINYEQNRDIFTADRQEAFKRFIRIVKDYRFMGGEFESPYYTREWWRNPDAIFEIYLFEYIIEQLFKKYGIANAPNAPIGSAASNFSHHVDQLTFEAVVKKFSKELVDMGLILPGRAISISDTISLLATLFQYQSSQVPEAVPVMDPNEATEFAVSLMSGINMSKVVHSDLKDTCGASEIDQYDRLSPNCFKQNFFRVFCDNYRRQYNLLFQDLNGNNSCEELVMNEYNTTYLQYTIDGSRTCNYYNDATGKPTTEEIWYSEGDIMAVIVEMMHIEATMIRWDKNRNNRWDPDEADQAYSVYSTALDGFLETYPSIVKKLKKKIYLYLLKFEKVPSTDSFGGIVKFVKFLVSFNQNDGASRKTMAAVLRAIGNENAKARADAGEKVWDCNWLKTPNDIPSDYDPNDPNAQKPPQ